MVQVATQLLTSKEKEELTELVDTMIGFGISYKHPKQGMLSANKAANVLEGQSVLMLEPPLDMLVKFNVSYLTQVVLNCVVHFQFCLAEIGELPEFLALVLKSFCIWIFIHEICAAHSSIKYLCLCANISALTICRNVDSTFMR